MAAPVEICPGCGKKLKLPPGTPPGTKFNCPKCGAMSTLGEAEPVGPDAPSDPEAASESAAAALKALVKPRIPRKAIPAERRGELLLATCPVCGIGEVFADKQSQDEHTYSCDACDSVLRESFIGFVYGKVDERFGKAQQELPGKTFTRPDLKALGAEAKREPDTSESSGERAAGADQPDQGDETGPPAGASEMVSDAAAQESGELFWEIDEEAMAERRRKEAERKQSSVTVDDLLDELSKD